VDFATLYRQNCAGCHGVDGKLGPGPPLNDPLFLALAPDAVLEQVISEGRSGTLMPAFAHSKGGTLTDVQVKVLAGGLKPRWGGAGQATDGVPPYVRSGDGSSERGAQVFARACAGCHGDNGRGVSKDGRTIRILNDPVFLALISDQELRRYVITGRPDLGMPDYAGSRPGEHDFRPLAPEKVNDLVALLASWRHSTSANGKRGLVQNPDKPAGSPK
jgi:cytochrome c oxidase cbb3-type subunit 3/ubiquinol-cytochrome c reductase cytochrome c subunit